MDDFFLEAVFFVLVFRFLFTSVVFFVFLGENELLLSTWTGSGVTGTELEPRTDVETGFVLFDLFCFGVSATDVSLVLLELRVTRLFLETVTEASDGLSSGMSGDFV